MGRKWAYYNDVDPNVCEWLRELIKMGQIAPGEVDQRSIVDVDAAELKPFCQIHLFAGIGVWSYALRQAGWADDREVFTGSCPCQGFSVAGRQKGFADDRHLWPEMYRLVRELRPECLIGEQVASKLALNWFDLVAGDLEEAGYAATAFDLPGASIGAPHIRQRLFWVGYAQHNGRNEECGARAAQAQGRVLQPQRPSDDIGVSILDHSDGYRNYSYGTGDREPDTRSEELPSRLSGGTIYPDQLANSQGRGDEWGRIAQECDDGDRGDQAIQRRDGESNVEGLRDDCGSSTNFWGNAVWLPCRDGKYRASHPEIYPVTPAQSSLGKMASGSATGVGCSGDTSASELAAVQKTQEGRALRLKGYGNSLVAPIAQEFVAALMEVLEAS